MKAQAAPDNRSRTLLKQVTCPHCWHRFAPEDVLWVAQHRELNKDPLLGENRGLRFLPSRFTHENLALDAKDMVCRELACPKCHLKILRDMLEIEPLFLSIVGNQASGKSYFLTAMMQQFRKILLHEFRVEFKDADPESNQILSDYINSMFARSSADVPVPLRDLIAKSELAGHLYQQVAYGEQVIRYPQPFVFQLRPSPEHPNSRLASQYARLMYLYDNAGEHFLPGAHKTEQPCADHLALSRAILFVFDLSQDPGFRARCRGATQPKAGVHALANQITVFNEVITRIKEYKGLRDRRYDCPFIVVLSKFDAWSHLLDDPGSPPWRILPQHKIAVLDLERVRARSRKLRELLMTYCKDIVATVDGFANEVVYIAVSTIGARYEADRMIVTDRGEVSIRPKDIQPHWVEVPLLYALSRALPGLIPQTKPREP